MPTIERISALIAEKHPSDYAFADAFGIPQKMVYDWKNDRSKTYMKMLPKLAEHFGVSAAYLLCETDDPSPDNEKNPAIDSEAYRLAERIMRMSPENQAKMLEHAQLLENQRKH